MTADREEALDVAQEAFVRACERWRSVSRLDRPDLWTHRVAINVALSRRRRRKTEANARARVSQERTGAPVWEEADQGLAVALQKLPPAQRAAVVVRYCLDQSVEQTAALLGKRPGTVRALTSQALARLRGLVQREGVSNEA